MATGQDFHSEEGDSAEDGVGGYDPRFFADIAAVEDRHFWFHARAQLIAAAVGSLTRNLPLGYRVIEVGCGTGGVLRELRQACRDGEVCGFDLYPEAVELARKKSGCRVICGDIMEPPGELGQFDIVCLFDVLEHLRDESQTLTAVGRLLKTGGKLVLTVPAHTSLWSYFDIAACHCRRYESEQLTHVLKENGFEVEYVTEFMTILFPIIWFSRRFAGATFRAGRAKAADMAASELRVLPGLNQLLKWGLAWEPSMIRRRVRLPCGTSLLAIAGVD